MPSHLVISNKSYKSPSCIVSLAGILVAQDYTRLILLFRITGSDKKSHCRDHDVRKKSDHCCELVGIIYIGFHYLRKQVALTLVRQKQANC